ncbi:MAG: GIY-YIG nuclease family protein [Thiohalospira sp.]
MKNYYVYIIKCADKSYYTGITNDINRRLNEHNHGLNKKSYTFSRRPVEMVYYESFQNPNEAILWEKRIKGWTRQKKEALIRGDIDELKRLSNKKGHTSTGSV